MQQFAQNAYLIVKVVARLGHAILVLQDIHYKMDPVQQLVHLLVNSVLIQIYVSFATLGILLQTALYVRYVQQIVIIAKILLHAMFAAQDIH